MCVATSWTASKVAVLLIVFDLFTLLAGYSVFGESNGPTVGLMVLAAVLGLMGGAWVRASWWRKNKQPRFAPAALLIAGVLFHVLWYATMHGKRTHWTGLTRECCTATESYTVMPPKLAELLKSVPRNSSTSEQVWAKAIGTMEANEATLQTWRKQRGLATPEPGSEKAERAKQSACEQALYQVTLGKLPQAVQLANSVSMLAALLAALAAFKVWCEDTKSGQAFWLQLFPEHAGKAD